MEMSAIEYEDSLAHYGILRKSGRYPWGSGANPHQRSRTFLDIIEEHKKDGLSEAEIAKLYQPVDKNGKPVPPYFTVADLRAIKSRSVHIQTEARIRQAQRLQDKGMGPSAIARQMGVNESTVRSLLEPGRLDRLDQLQKTADMLKRQVGEKGIIDVGAHVERDIPIGENPETKIGISKDKFNTALSMLKEEGYTVQTFRAPQQGTGEMTTYKVLFKPPKPNMSEKELRLYAWANRNNVQLISEKTKDRGRTYEDDLAFKKPLSVDLKRVDVKYKEDGGANADGVIFVRPGVKDVSLGKNQYAQVRIAVGGTHFLKGMAIYKNDLPPGVDLQFNTNKSNTGNKLDAMKPLKKGVDGKIDWKNPFGAFPKPIGGQIKDESGKVTSSMNILNEQGDWHSWSKTISSQMLAKQKPELAESQLDVTHDRKRQEYEEIKALTNPLIKRKLLETFADEADSSAVHLKAAHLPRQATKVILPVSSIKPGEIFAPTFNNGEKVSLVRFPHAGTFEIPELTVNNNNREAKALFRKPGSKQQIEAPDAVGIHPKVAEHLSGADFDGDHVVVIPNRKGLIQNRPPLEGLKNFDPQKYKVPTPDEDPVHGRKTIDERRKQNEMGKVSNLISDMTIRGAKDDDLAAAVRHSMVVIDSEKHNLDFKASERDNGILNLKRTYQGVNEKTGQPRGASTLLTRAGARADVPKRRDARVRPGLTRLGNATVDNKTGKKVYDLTGEIDKRTGKTALFRSRKAAETDDAFTLISEHPGTRVERIYAKHSNRLKALANEARLEAVRTQPIKRNKSSAEVYSNEVASLKGKLNNALKNAPLERRAQRVADIIVSQRRQANPNMDKAEVKKIRGQALEEARVRTGAKKHRIDITDREWEAIQHGAISIQNLRDILGNTDVDKLRERATPRKKTVMTSSMTNRAKQMRSSGATYAEISEALGIPTSTLQSSLGEG
jgi:hypothetical protein